MSFEAMAWAVEQDLPCTDKMVLLMLANRVNKDTGQCTPSISRLAKDSGLSERTTRDAIRRLEDAGMIETIHRKADEKTNLSNSYRMCQSVPVGRQMPQGGAANTPGGGAVAAGEPVRLEPVIEPACISSSSDDDKSSEKSKSDDRIPYSTIFDLFEEICVSLPKTRIRDDARKSLIKKVWKMDEQHQDVEFFNWLFNKVESSDFLSGRSGKYKNCGFDWILKPANFKKIVEGNYDNR